MTCHERKRVAVCETQPVTALGLKALLSGCPDLEFTDGARNLGAATELLLFLKPDLVVVDKSFGIQAILEWLGNLKGGLNFPVETIIWGGSITEAEALRFLQAGARGIVRKTADPDTLCACIRAVAHGSSWMEDSVFRQPRRMEQQPHCDLTPRESQVLELVEQGLKNREIARELSIRPGTVKIHLKHIFEKTGVRGRYGLALSQMREKGILDLAKAS